MYPGLRKLKPFNMTMPVWSPDDSSLIRKSRQVFVEIARINAQDKKVQNLEVVTVRRRMKSDKEKLDEQYSSGLFSGGNATIFDLMNDPFASILQWTYLLISRVRWQVCRFPPAVQHLVLSWRGSTPGLLFQ